MRTQNTECTPAEIVKYVQNVYFQRVMVASVRCLLKFFANSNCCTPHWIVFVHPNTPLDPAEKEARTTIASILHVNTFYYFRSTKFPLSIQKKLFSSQYLTCFWQFGFNILPILNRFLNSNCKIENKISQCGAILAVSQAVLMKCVSPNNGYASFLDKQLTVCVQWLMSHCWHFVFLRHEE